MPVTSKELDRARQSKGSEFIAALSVAEGERLADFDFVTEARHEIVDAAQRETPAHIEFADARPEVTDVALPARARYPFCGIFDTIPSHFRQKLRYLHKFIRETT